ncbi:hypothetical protein BO94DRAFT_567774 [Aspergillus sclerotioniger CBS 115572]|uniref:Vacuolar ATPase assembly protein VMA22 n=1 Tax=Aspergillus sclerotioniger CBS 115572 TaxID=1450535 RepID=A0A317W0M6_9EURO|nr:hypothetical protein BO94DRAFT_567774 [Aspergillus sclerotioniger CBS 115572]PWY79449.1 hypothetical protein BO94DRAFT_567774 [Aspergillus sclerotioniger CBS 115572]
MAQIPTPPASRSASPAPDAEPKQAPVAESPVDLLQSLDNLLERYLRLLDQHQKLQAELGSKLSSGYFSLAQANYTCPPGRHYGADYYDERMKATKRVSLQLPTNLAEESYATEAENLPEADTKDSNFKSIFEIETVTVRHTEDESEIDDKIESDTGPSQEDHSGREESNSQSGESPATPKPQTEGDTDAKPKRSKKKFRSSNPIHWYGILVPPYLRSAQKSFTEAVEGRLPQLASVIVEMRIVEKEVERVRSELGQI